MTAGYVAIGVVLCGLLGACGDEPTDPRQLCGGDRRLVVQGKVGPSRFGVSLEEPHGGLAGETYLTIDLEGSEPPHLIGLTTNTALEVDLWSALVERLRGGGEDPGALSVATRPIELPCDPREGVICASYGIDANGDGILFGANEVTYPVESGELVVTSVSGNTIEGDFEMTFGPLSSGAEEGGETGGRLAGCFRLNRTADGRRLF